MGYFSEIRKILNGGGMYTRHYKDGRVVVQDSCGFRGIKMSALDEAIRVTDGYMRDGLMEMSGGKVETLKSIRERAERNVGVVMDSISGRGEPVNIRDSILNGRWNIANGADPAMSTLSLPNVYISPYEANSLYSQKGIFETIINKKAKSILLNGIRLENSHLTQEQIDEITEHMEIKNFKEMLSDAVLNSLVYGGSLVFPMFKKESPYTTALPLSALLKSGVVGKDCVDYFVTLDRWQTFIIPPYNPVQRDFMYPEVYTVPFLGGDVHHTRCGRVVTARQAGYWGQVINQGWGISDLCGYLQSGMNYKVAVQSLPLMIQQMSILARVINVDGVLATEGSNALDALVEGNTIVTREASADNPVTMDVLGDIKSINRNFGQVPELIRLLRQDLASDAVIPEPMLFSSEKGNFSSGDDTQGNLAKQHESIKMLHKEVEGQFRQLAKIMIVDALGTDKEVMESLPYTKVHFDEPVVANALERAQIGKYFSEEVFNLVSARLPVDLAVDIASKNVSQSLVNSMILDKLKDVQNEADEQNRMQFEQRMEMGDVQIENAKINVSAVSSQGSVAKEPLDDGGDKEEGYSRLEQKQHEISRLGHAKREEKLSKFNNKRL